MPAATDARAARVKAADEELAAAKTRTPAKG